MSFFAGFSGRFGEELARSRSEEADRAEKQSALESSILQHLSTSTDPEIQAHALAGLVDLAGPRKSAKGLSGWLGKVAEHPALPTIRQLMTQGKQREVEDQPAQAPRLNVQANVPAVMPGAEAPVAAPAGRPMMGPADPDTPEPAPSTLGPPPAFQSGFKPGTTKTITEPRQIFDTPEQAAEKQARATTRGGFRGKVDVMRGVGTPGQGPLTPEEQEILFPDKRTLQSSGTIQGKLAPQGSVDNSGRALDPEGYYLTKLDPRDPQKPTYVPTIAPASVANQAAINARPTFQMYAGPDGKTPARYRVYRDGSKPAEFLGYIPQRGSYLPYVNPDTGETTYQQAAAPMTPVPASPGAPPVAGAVPRGTPVAGPAPAVPQAPGVAAPTSAAPGQPPRAGAPPPAGARTGPAGIPGGRMPSRTEKEGAYIGPNGEPQIGTALFDNKTGRYYMATNPTQEATGFIPGAEGAAVTQNYATANNTLMMIEEAMKAIENAGLMKDNNPENVAKLANQFYGGTLGDSPAKAAVASLTNVSALQGATQYVRSASRSWQMWTTASMHLPRMPSERVAAMTGLPVIGGMVNPDTARLAGSHGWDSWAAMYEKLKQAKMLFQQGKQELATLTGKTADRAIGAGGAPAGGPPPAAAPEEFIGPDGKIYIKTGVNPDGSVRGRLKGG